MAEIGTITELQQLEQDISLLKKELGSVKTAEQSSSVCARILGNIEKSEAQDGFVVKEGGASEANQFHTSAGTPQGDSCCAVL
mmetsp:Transcript_50703/g.75799  ORF Transcript_50703/g.75799 Transcript_50703/m.75799 type:complete len:83 (-) Transcript_50703:228-476(-)|eukprot:CAMPEP_0194028366 /NCGR_PEP_ID=MMETSP0009_2-20130614/2353_1 /TAXON_ID=210454 /ORGANISM="Grammatophora oceanica, Strain CCMP 410" /LENGTH=82 /DNA_ID=CAMNT_0038667737 /DNA_START=155 /DNA_END=403 /DNA_ORIENTATION=+